MCGESDNGFLGGGDGNAGGGNQCIGGQVDGGPAQKHDGWAHAANICAASGARQCTVSELQAEETRWSGCQHDIEFVWPGEPCSDVTVGTAGADAHWAAMGGNHCGAGGCGNGGCQDTDECVHGD